MTLTCPDCHFRNTEVTFGGEIQEKGARIVLKVKKGDLDRQVIKSDSCTISVPSLELDIPPECQRGNISTIEGVLKKAEEGLGDGQAIRATQDVDAFRKVQGVIDGIRELLDEEKEWDFVIDDPAGNSFGEFR